MEKYYNVCSSLNEMLNSFCYANGTIWSEDNWIFIIKHGQRSSKCEVKPQMYSFNLTSIDELNTCIKSLKHSCKRQIGLMNAIYHQKNRVSSYKLSNNLRCSEDYRFVAESLRTTNRIHKQRLKNLEKDFAELRNKVLNIDDIFKRLEWLICKESKNLFILATTQRNNESEFGNILNQTWETLTLDEAVDTVTID